MIYACGKNMALRVKQFFVICIVGLIGIAQLATADVLIYKLQLSDTQTGNGKSVKTLLTGYIVVDPKSDTIAEMLAIPANRQFDTTWPNDLVISDITEPKSTKQETLISSGLIHFGMLSARGATAPVSVNNLTAQGPNVLLKTGSTNQWSWPKAFRVTGGTNVNANITNRFQGTYSYDQSLTINANSIDSGDITQTARTLRQTLIKVGYSESEIPASEVDGTFDSSSYDTSPYKLWGNYFCDAFLRHVSAIHEPYLTA